MTAGMGQLFDLVGWLGKGHSQHIIVTRADKGDLGMFVGGKQGNDGR